MSRATEYYDVLYDFKDYPAESARLLALAQREQRSQGRRWLDVACGTGQHIEHLRAAYEVQGLDCSEAMLEIARKRNPGVRFHQGDMTAFALGASFDVISCLFSSIGYAKTLDAVERAIDCMAGHLVPGGLLLVEPWFSPEAWNPGTTHMLVIDEPELKIARVSTSLVNGRLSYFDLHHLIATPQGTDHVVEHHELGLFTAEEMQAAFVNAGLTVRFDPEGLIGRGLLVGLRPMEAAA
jgi:SAM-dependent methyltransferase